LVPIAFPISDKKHFWSIRILHINKKAKYKIFELSPLEYRIVKNKIRCKDSLVISRHGNFKISQINKTAEKQKQD